MKTEARITGDNVELRWDCNREIMRANLTLVFDDGSDVKTDLKVEGKRASGTINLDRRLKTSEPILVMLIFDDDTNASFSSIEWDLSNASWKTLQEKDQEAGSGQKICGPGETCI